MMRSHTPQVLERSRATTEDVEVEVEEAVAAVVVVAEDGA